MRVCNFGTSKKPPQLGHAGLQCRGVEKRRVKCHGNADDTGADRCGEGFSKLAPGPGAHRALAIVETLRIVRAMHPLAWRSLGLALLLFLSPVFHGWSDAPTPSGVLDPKSASECWNIIRLATKNVQTLLEENRLTEVPVQISYTSPSLRFLARVPTDPLIAAKLDSLVARAFTSVNAIATSAARDNPVGAKNALTSLRKVLDLIAEHFDPKIVRADIFFCPMHSDFLAENPKTPCGKCGMDLLTRRIPYSFIYTKPGEPTVRMKAIADGPIAAGKKVKVKVTLEKAEKSPLLPADLMVMHTEPIHLLIEDPALSDYHHEHPVETGTPGEYEFSFLPKKSAPYRIWADLVPVATGIQELPFADLPSTGKSDPIADTEDRFTSSAGGFQFELVFTDGNHLPTKASVGRSMSVRISHPSNTMV